MYTEEVLLSTISRIIELNPQWSYLWDIGVGNVPAATARVYEDKDGKVIKVEAPCTYCGGDLQFTKIVNKDTKQYMESYFMPCTRCRRAHLTCRAFLEKGATFSQS